GPSEGVEQEDAVRESGQPVVQGLLLRESPAQHVREARREDEPAVDDRPLPRMGYVIRVVVDGRGVERTDDAVLAHDVNQREDVERGYVQPEQPGEPPVTLLPDLLGEPSALRQDLAEPVLTGAAMQEAAVLGPWIGRVGGSVRCLHADSAPTGARRRRFCP